MTEKEPPKENEIWCAYCGPGWKAAWEIVTDEEQISVCNDHHFVLRQIHAVELERQIGGEDWEEVIDSKDQDLEGEYMEDIGDWKDLINYDDV